jgi:hypothetical protein
MSDPEIPFSVLSPRVWYMSIPDMNYEHPSSCSGRGREIREYIFVSSRQIFLLVPDSEMRYFFGHTFV